MALIRQSLLFVVCLFQVIVARELIAATRRDITTLAPAELRAYRDAFRAIQISGEYARLAGYHSCPDHYCHDESPYRRFLPWHRAYVLKFEQALQHVDPNLALHYWDWTSSDAERHGLPAAFTDRDYASGGNTYPNPLRQFQFNCGGENRPTRRSPIDPSNLLQLRNEVNNAFGRTSYNGFNANTPSPMGIQWPHGGLHGWVGGDMGSATYAAYDPIFWAHHSNVDRQWAAWQESSNGADPDSTIQALPLEPFSMVVSDVLSYRALGYDYDRLRPSPIVFRLASDKKSAVLKNFEVPKQGEQLGLYVHDLPDHPAKSYRVFVFVDQPEATVKDAKRDNPHYVGFFAIFGGSHGKREAHEAHIQTVRVLELAPTVRRLAGRRGADATGDLTISILATDPDGAAVDIGDLPFKDISVQPGDSQVQRDDKHHGE
jgi:tyrosinase